MSLMLVVGLVPTPAFAEAAEEMAMGEEQTVAAVPAGDDSVGGGSTTGDDAADASTSSSDSDGQTASDEPIDGATPAEDAEPTDDATPTDGAEPTVTDDAPATEGDADAVALTQQEEPLEEDEQDARLSTSEEEQLAVQDAETKTVEYIERHWDGTKVVSEEKTRSDVKVFPYSGTVFPGGWYVVDGGRDFSKRICFTGDTHIILTSNWDVFKLGWLRTVGIYIPEGCTLSIYCQSEKYGSLPGLLDVSGVENGAGIGGYPGHTGGDVVIHGGIIGVTGAKNCAGIGSNDGQSHTGSLTVYGGNVHAEGGENGAGIGGGRGCDGGNVTIYEGAVTPKGGDNGAGIGGGKGGNGGTVTIHGGTILRPQITYDPTVYYNGGDNGAGIGGGQGGNAGTITIDGGNVSVFAVNNGAGIGCGDGGEGGSVTINGGTVNANGGDDGAGIGGGEDGYCDVAINGGTVTANGGRQAAAIGGGNNANGGTIAITGGKVTANANSTRGRGIGSGYDSDNSTPITLGYTDETRDGISITASSFKGAVTLEQPFKNASGFYAVGSSPDLAKLASGTLKAWDTEKETWAQLQVRIDNADDGETITLQQSYEAQNSDSRLTFDSDTSKELTLDLNGYTLNRAMQTSDANGSVIYVGQGSILTITDSAGGGVITGGKATNGGGIYCDGTLTIASGTIKENAAASNGGGVYLPNNSSSTLYLNGGTITGNTCGANGGGVYANNTVAVSGNPRVSGNKKGDDNNNLWLKEENPILVRGALTEDADLSVLPEKPGVITNGYHTHNGTTSPQKYFSADDARYAPFLQNGEVRIQEATYKQTSASYVERSWNGKSVVKTNRTKTAFLVPENANMTSGWYYLDKDVTSNRRITLTDNTNLILGDDHTLEVKGIYIPEGKKLNIYAQSGGTGKLISKASSGAGIGATSDNHPGGSVVIHGGVIEAEGGDNCAAIGSNDGNGTTSPITIYDGTVTVHGGENGAGIGGGRDCEGGTITIYGGTVYTRGGSDAAGIGGGEDGKGGTIAIYGGTITANEDPNENAAAIGGGENGDGGTITIHGGTITTWSRDGAGIGGGEDGDGGTITINGGTVTCNDKGAAQGARIGGGNNGDGGTITINGGAAYPSFRDGAGIGGGEDGDGGTITITGGLVHSSFAEGSAGNGAAIGGGNHAGDGGTINITGGRVIAYSNHGAGIGGGRGEESINPWADWNSGRGGTISIMGGEVYATCDHGFGIGAGGEIDGFSKTPYNKYIGNVGTVTIGGGAYVEAEGAVAGIGGDGDGTITIEGGKVIARGSESKNCGRGIMMVANEEKNKGTLYIKGGHVEAYGCDDFPGISSEFMNVSITGGDVYAYSPKACGIGGAQGRGVYGYVSIEGKDTVVRAKSDEYGGIDGGFPDDRTIRGTFYFGPGITLELWSPGLGDKHQTVRCCHRQAFYTEAKYTVGSTKEKAKILPSWERVKAYTNNDYKYMLIEPCDHRGRDGDSLIDSNGICYACGYGDKSQMTYVEYSFDENGLLRKDTLPVPEDAKPFPEDGSSPIPAGWYYVNGHTKIDDRIILQGDIHLILCDDYYLDVDGIYVPQGKTLSIYGQSGGTGKLISKPSSGAGIGAYDGHKGGDVVVHGGTIEAKGASYCAGIGSNDGDGSNVGSFTMYDGTVTATGGSNGAGIGGGRNCDSGQIAIFSGTVTATGKDDSAGIGGGDSNSSTYGNASQIKIFGGTVTATCAGSGAAIGGADYGTASVEVQGGMVNATCTGNGQGIGSGGKNSSGDSTIALGYTDDTKDTIAVTASSFAGRVVLQNPFRNDNGNYPTYESPDLAAMAGSTLRSWDGEQPTTWKDLQRLIDGADGRTIKLEQDFTAEGDDVALQVASGKTITIDLNGHTLNRNLTNTKTDGSVIRVGQGANLTIEDGKGGGVITGGYSQRGGGVYCEGALTVNGGSIQGNKASWWGGGVYLADDTNATLHLNGGTITGNVCPTYNYNSTNDFTGGGIHVSKTASITVSGGPVVTGNKRGTGDSATDNNVALAHGAKIKVAGKLEDGANLGVTILPASGAPIGTFTSDYGKYNQELPSTYFHSDDSQYSVVTASANGYTEGRIDTGVRGVSYLSYEWADDKLVETVESTEGNWMAWPDATSVPGGMYVLNRSVTKNNRVTLQDNTWIILCDDCTLDVKGLYIPKGKTLTIYGQSGGTGKLISKPSSGGAGIGATSDNHPGGNVVIHGGTIEATGDGHCAGIGSNDGNGANVGDFTMYNGTVTATGGSQGAGIGGGRDCDGGHITIYGGTVTATGKDSSAGIGGGDPKNKRADDSTIEIYGGTVTATGGSKGAGIGGGEYGRATVTIAGGTVTATGGSTGGAGIGSGADGGASVVTIAGGVVKAFCYTNGYGIGNGKNGKGSTVGLDYTNATKDTISVTAASFGGTVTMEKPFRMEGKERFFDPGVVGDNGTLVGGALISWPSYAVTVEDAEHGTVRTDVSVAHKDAVVGIDAVPDEGYELASLTATDGDGTSVNVVTVPDGNAVHGTLWMPDSSVTVSATFRKTHYNLTFFEDTAGQKVWRMLPIKSGTSLGIYATYGTQEPNLLRKDGYTFAGWATEPNVVVDSYKTKGGALNPELEGKLVDFNTMMTTDVDAYPIWIRDRLNVVLGLDVPDMTIDAAQESAFTVNIDEKIVMRYLVGATRDGYDLDGWYTQDGVLWNGENWKTLEYATEGWTETSGWGVTPEYCDKDASGNPIKQTNIDRKFNYYTVTLTSRWTPKQVGVAYDLGGGTGEVADTNTYGLGDAITIATATPTPEEGKTFTGWKIGDSETLYGPGDQFAFNDWSLVGENNMLTFTAQYVATDVQSYTVYFNANGGTPSTSVTVPAGTKIAAPTATWDGHGFIGWYDGETKVEFPYTVTDSKTLAAHWEHWQPYTITFDSAGGTPVNAMQFYAGEQVNAPTPKKTHYTFGGWYPALPSAMPAQDLAVVATWTPEAYHISFNSDGGTQVTQADGAYGSLVEAPEEPTKNGFVFAGWTGESGKLGETGELVEFPLYMPDTNPTLTAKWKVAQAVPEVQVQALDARSVEVTDPLTGVEYVIVPAGQEPSPKDWANATRGGSAGVTFEGLSPATSYDVWARRYETDVLAQSDAAKTTVATPKEQQNPPAKPTAWANNDTTAAVREGSDAQEYALVPKGEPAPVADSDAWRSPDANGKVGWTGLVANTEYDVYARMRGTSTKEPSAPSEATTVKTSPAHVTGVKLNSSSAKKDYNQGDPLDVSGLTLEVTRSDGGKETIAVTANMVSGFDSSRAGKQTLTVTYEGYTSTYEVEVKAPAPTPTPTPTPTPAKPARATKPSTVAHIAARAIGVTWKAVKGAKTYELSWRIAGGKKWKTKTVKATKATIKGLKAGKLYDVRVRAVNDVGKGAWSTPTRRWYKSVSKVKAAAGKSKGSVKVTWKKDKSATGGYKVSVYAKRGGKVVKTKTVSKAKASVTIKGLKSGKTYYVRVRPYRKRGGTTYAGAISGYRSVRAK